MRETVTKEIKVEGAISYEVETIEDFFEALKLGNTRRQVAETNLNARSSRSHTILVIHYDWKNEEGRTKQGKLNLVDLAGSEKAKKTGATGQTLKEGAKINLSLTYLG